MKETKLSTDSLIKIFAGAMLVAILAYEGYYLYDLYNVFNTQPANDFNLHVAHIDSGSLQKALSRYNSALAFSTPNLNIYDPFAVKMPSDLDTSGSSSAGSSSLKSH